MKFLTAHCPAQRRSGDFYFAATDELVHESVDPEYSAFLGVDSGHGTTTAEVIDAGDLDFAALATNSPAGTIDAMYKTAANVEHYRVGTVVRIHRHNDRWIYTTEAETAVREWRDAIQADLWYAAVRAERTLRTRDWMWLRAGINQVIDGMIDAGLGIEDDKNRVMFTRCTECDINVDHMTIADRDRHLIREGVILVGCEGYYTPQFIAAYRFDAEREHREIQRGYELIQAEMDLDDDDCVDDATTLR